MKYSLRQVEFFCAVARTLHFGRAAKQLFVSQSVVSQEIQRLEARLGVMLFDRSTRNVRLTAEGAQLVSVANEVLAASERFSTIAALVASERRLSVRVAASPSAMNHVVPLLLRLCDDALPHLEVIDVPVETGDVGAALARGEAEVGIGRFLDVLPPFRSEKMREEPLYCALSAEHPLSTAPSIALGDLADLPLLLWPRERNPRYYDDLIRACTDDDLDPLVLVSHPRIIGSRSYLIAENRAFGLIPESAANAPVAGIRTVPLRSRHTLPLEIAWLDSDPRPVIAEFLTLARTAAMAPLDVP